MTSAGPKARAELGFEPLLPGLDDPWTVTARRQVRRLQHQILAELTDALTRRRVDPGRDVLDAA